MTHYYVLDTETTGVTDDAGVCEIAWIEIDEDFNIIETVESLIDPQQPISPSASGTHGLVNADLQDSPTLREFFEVVRGKGLAGPAVVIGHRVGFDTKFLPDFVEGGISEVCTLRWARSMYPDHDNHKLSTLMYALNLPKTGSHRALGDVMTAYWLMRHICDMHGFSLSELAARSKEPLPVRYMPFGKHKGQPLAEVPVSYLRWALKEMKNLDIDLKHAFEVRARQK